MYTDMIMHLIFLDKLQIFRSDIKLKMHFLLVLSQTKFDSNLDVETLQQCQHNSQTLWHSWKVGEEQQ